jgi:trehalose 6-phosphate phosphatase
LQGLIERVVRDPIARRLERLARVRPVAIISGRSIDDVEPRLGFSPQFVIGNHGAEDRAQASPDAEVALDPLRLRLRLHAQALDDAGVEVEDKRLSVALHYRLARDRQLALSLITSLLRRPHESTRIFGGKCVLNVMPADAPDKGDAMHTLVRRCGAAARPAPCLSATT